MVDDLRASSRRWEAERQRPGHRGMDEMRTNTSASADTSSDAYQESQSYAVAGGGMPPRRPGDVPMGPMDPRYRDAPLDRGARPQDRMYPDDHMAVDPPYGQVPPGRYQQQDRVERYGDDMTYGQGGRPLQHRQDPRDPRGPYHDGRDYPQHGSFMPEQRFGGRMPEPDMRDARGDYRGDPRAQPGFAGMNGPPPPPDYGRPPEMYNAGPPNLPYGSAQPMHAPPRGMEPAFPGPQFGATAGQPGPPAALGPPGPHGPPRNDRYPPQTSGFGQEMRDPRDPRYAYPSPAQSSVDPRENIQSPPQHKYDHAVQLRSSTDICSTFGHGGPPQGNVNPQFDQYGGRRKYY